jgi:hypothetical protein
MKQLVLNIPENEYRFFMRVLRSFPFVEIDEKKIRLLERKEKLSRTNFKTWNNIKQSLTEVELIEKGQLKVKTANELLDEL